jgi:hypothetical protein
MNLSSSDDLLQSFHTIVTDVSLKNNHNEKCNKLNNLKVLVQSCDAHCTENMHSFMKVFHIFVMCVRKWQQKCALTNKHDMENPKPSSKCVVEDILEYHRLMTMDFEDKDWEENDNSNTQPWYILPYNLIVTNIYAYNNLY